MFRGRYVRLAILGAAGLAACGGNDVVLPNDRLAAKIVAAHGDNQTGTVGGALADSAVVRVTDAKDQPVSGQTVTFSVVSGGGSVSPGTTTTDANGLAGTRWTLGGVAGAQQIRAQASGNGAPASVAVLVNASAGASAATAIALVGGDNQTGTAGSPLTDSLVVKATDADGNPVAGAAVQWTVAGGGTVSAATTPTGADGHAAVKRTLGPSAGAQTAVATATGLTGSPITFHSAATVGSAGQLSITRQPSAGAASDVAFAVQPQVQLRDANGNPVSQGGVAVQVQIASGPPSGGLIGSTTAATNGSGLATFSGLGISGPAGDYFLSFFGSGLSGVTSAQITIAAGSATKLVMQTQPSSSAANGVAFATQPVVQLADASGNPVLQSGVSVSVVLASGSGSLGGTTTATTDGSGLAAFTDLVITGNAGARTLLFASACCSTVTSSAINVGAGSPDGAKSSFNVSGGPITASTGSSTATVSITARDASGNPVAGAAPGVDITSCGSASAPLTDASGSSSVAVSCTTSGTKTVSVAINGAPVTNPAGTHTLTVNPASSSSTLAASPAGGSTFGQEVTFTATVTGGVNPPTGTVTFKDGATTLGSPSLDGTGHASVGTSSLAAASHSITATYNGDATYGTSSDGLAAYVIGKANTTTALSDPQAPSSNTAQQVTLTATVSASAPGAGTPAGSVDFKDGATTIATKALVTGTASFKFLPPVGLHSYSASYTGSGSYNGSTSSAIPHTVTLFNQPPVANDDSYSVNEDNALTVTATSGVLANDTDPDGPPPGTATLVSGPASGSLTLNADGSFSYTPAANFNGSVTFTYKASDGVAQSNTATVTITVNPVNDPPSFAKGADQTVSAADGVISVPGWATGISAGPSNESTQSVTSFTVSLDATNNGDPAALSSPPAVAVDGTLTFTTNTSFVGPTTLTYRVVAQDNGGSANGGSDTSAPQTFTITVD